VRRIAGLASDVQGAPMDVLWMRLPRRADDPAATFGHAEAGRIFIMLNRGDYWQCAYVIAKGSFDELKRGGLAVLRTALVELSPFLAGRVALLQTWDDVKLLTVAVDRLRTWHRPGLLCIGDAAHAMSPIGGVGINLAIQDAVATANLLAGPLLSGKVSEVHLASVQRRREPPARRTQALQLQIQDRIIRRVLGSRERLRPPLALRLLQWLPVLRRIPARLVGIGFRPEHVHVREA
jgi:2-polyprenyl-6-methoxyphenol hydroxylase-like FAD-dependent oxidoreductase